MQTRAISIGMLAVSLAAGGVMLEYALSANPSNTALFFGWGIVIVMAVIGATMYFRSEKRSDMSNDQTTGIKIKARKNAVVTRVRLEGFDNPIDMDVDENGYISDVDATAPKKKEKE